MNFMRFIFSKTFYINLGIILVVSALLLFFVVKGLNSYTGLGDYILVPQLNTYDGDSLVENSDPNFLQYVLIDSIYDAKARPGGVAHQHPRAGAKVKKGRKIYLTIVSKGQEYIPMPNLIDLSIRRAIDVLDQSRLKVNQLIFVENFARNAVLAQMIRQDTIPADSMILIGSAINLIVGNGHNPSGVHVPFLIGKTPSEAREIILKSSLNCGGMDTLYGSPKTDLRVYWQSPNYDQQNVLLGDEMRLTLRSSIGFDFDSLIFNMLNDTISKNIYFSDSLLLNTVLDEF